MTTRYTKVNEGIDVKVHEGYLYVRLTGIRKGMVVQGERAGRINRKPYEGTVENAIAEYQTRLTNDCSSASQITRCACYGEIVKKGRLIR